MDYSSLCLHPGSSRGFTGYFPARRLPKTHTEGIHEPTKKSSDLGSFCRCATIHRYLGLKLFDFDDIRSSRPQKPKRDSTGVVSTHHDVIRYCSIYPRRLVSPFRHLDRSRHPIPTPEQNSWLKSRCATIIWEVLNLSLECVYVYAYDSCGGRLKTRFDVFAAVIPALDRK